MRNYIYSLCGLFFCLPLFAQSALNWAIYQDSLAQTSKIGVQKQLMMRYYEASFTYNQAVDSSWRSSKYQEAGDLALVSLAYAYLGAYKRPYVEELTALVQDQLSWAEEQATERLPYYYLAYHYLGYLENLELPAQKERLDKALLWLEKNEENYHELLKLDLYREGASFHFGLANEPETATGFKT